MNDKGTDILHFIFILEIGISVVHKTINKGVSNVTKINNRGNNKSNDKLLERWNWLCEELNSFFP